MKIKSGLELSHLENFIVCWYQILFRIFRSFHLVEGANYGKSETKNLRPLTKYMKQNQDVRRKIIASLKNKYCLGCFPFDATQICCTVWLGVINTLTSCRASSSF